MLQRVVAAIAACGVLLGLFAYAPTAKALTISPPTFDFAVDPGDAELGVIRLYNEEETTITVYPVVMNFTYGDDESGTPQLYPATENIDGTGMASWVALTSPPALVIEPQGRVNVPFVINVPRDAQPGGHYGAVMFSSVPPGTLSERGVGVGAQVGALFLVRVSGEVREAGAIAEFGFVQPRPWHNALPIDLFLRFENSGNSHLRPVGNVFITNIFGRQVAALKVNQDFRNVLPNSIRRFTFGWQKNEVPKDAPPIVKEWKNFAFGRYTATLVINYGSTNSVLTKEVVFYVWPWRLMLAFGGSTLFILLILRMMKRRYDRGVIAKFQKMQSAK